MQSLRGGNNLAKALARAAAKITSAKAVNVGYLEGATYPGVDKHGQALSVPTVAFWDNFGTSRAPARPFFSYMVKDNSPLWGQKLAGILKAANYDAKVSLGRMGVLMNDDLVKEIVSWPADNAKSTEARKGFNKGLIDKGVMQRSSSYEVVS